MVAQALVLAGFCFFAYHNYLYSAASLTEFRHEKQSCAEEPVAVVIVSFNEGDILERTIESCLEMTYENKLILLADDSNDPDVLARMRLLIDRFRCVRNDDCDLVQTVQRADGKEISQHIEIWESESLVYLHRPSNKGFKGGSLRVVHEYLKARGIQAMYLLDADWRPQPDAIERTLEVLRANPALAFVQTKRVTNRQNLSLFQRYIMINEEACYHVDFQGRQVMGHPILFSGCCTLIDLKQVAAVNGFSGDSHLTEDLDLSNRLWVNGLSGAYLSDVVNVGEVPLCYGDFARQQKRWAIGTARALRDYTPGVLTSPHLGWTDKLSILRQNAYFSCALLTTAALAIGVATIIWLILQPNSYASELYLARVTKYSIEINTVIILCAISTAIGSLVSLLRSSERRRDLIHLPMSIWIGWSITHVYAVGTLLGLLRRPHEWFRTPKRSQENRRTTSSRSWKSQALYLGVAAVFMALYAIEIRYLAWFDVFAFVWIPAYSLVGLGLTQDQQQ